jgi:hypothetical protein
VGEWTARTFCRNSRASSPPIGCSRAPVPWPPTSPMA